MGAGAGAGAGGCWGWPKVLTESFDRFFPGAGRGLGLEAGAGWGCEGWLRAGGWGLGEPNFLLLLTGN